MSNKEKTLNFYHQLGKHPLRISRFDRYNLILEQHRKGRVIKSGEATEGWRLVGYYPNIHWLVSTADNWLKTYPKYLKIKKSEQSPEFKKNMKSFKEAYNRSIMVADYLKDKDVNEIQKELDKAFNLANPPEATKEGKKRGRPKKIQPTANS